MNINANPDIAERFADHRRRYALTVSPDADRIHERADEWDTIAPNNLAGMENVDQAADVLAGVVDWLIRPSWSLVIVGDYGTGKSWLATAIAHEKHFAGASVKIATASKIVAGLKPGGGKRLDHYLDPEVLVIDGLAEVPLSKWDAGQIRAVLLDRYDNRRPTIITTNCTPAKLKQIVGGAAWSRLCETPFLALHGPDRRDPSNHVEDTDPIGLYGRLLALADIHAMPARLRAEVVEHMQAEIGHKIMDAGFTVHDADIVEDICADIRGDELEQRRARLGWIDALPDDARDLTSIYLHRNLGRSLREIMKDDHLLSVDDDNVAAIERLAGYAETCCRLQGVIDNRLSGTITGEILGGMIDDAVDEKRLPSRARTWQPDDVALVLGYLFEALAYGPDVCELTPDMREAMAEAELAQAAAKHPGWQGVEYSDDAGS